MKKFLSIISFAVIAMFVSSCTVEEINNSVTEQTTFRINVLAQSLETKAYFGNLTDNSYPVLWDNQEALFSLDGAKAVSATATPSEDKLTASFGVNFSTSPNENGGVIYSASPVGDYKSDPVVGGATAIWPTFVYYVVPTNQKPSETSVDPSALSVFGSVPYKTSVPETIAMGYKHILAYGKMTITNFGHKISSVSITLPVDVAGSSIKYYHTTDGDNEAGSYSGADKKTIVIDASELEGNTLWFGCLPTGTLKSGQMVIAVTDANGDVYEKKIDFSDTKSISFVRGQISKFSVNMDGIKASVKKSIVLTYDDITNPVSSSNITYGTHNWTKDGVSGVINGATSNSATRFQFNYSSSGSSNYRDRQAVYNTIAVPGEIKSIIMTTDAGETARSWSVYADPSGLNPTNYQSSTLVGTKSVTTAGTEFVVEKDGCSFFYLEYKSGSASYISSIEIIYVPGEVSPSITAESSLEIPYEECDGIFNVTWTNMEDVDVYLYSDEDCQTQFTESWLSVDLDEDNNVYYIAEENTANNTRTAYIQLYGVDAGAKEYTKVVSVTQSAAPIWYSIKVDQNIQGGKITASSSTAIEGTEISLTSDPDPGKALTAWVVKDSDNNSITVSRDGKFKMPASNVTVSATFGSNDSYIVDFEDLSGAYTNWTFVNFESQQTNTNVVAHGGDYFGTTGGKTTGSLTTKNAVNPQSIIFYVSKVSTNTTSSSWKVQVSSDGGSWTDVKTQSATSMDRGSWVEVTQDLSSYSNVYVRVSYTGTTAVRCIDDLTLTVTSTL